jgi:O-antigen ligase
LTVASIPFKNNGLSFLIAIIAGVFGFCGIGHIYIGKVLRGVLIMFIGWIPFGIGIIVFLSEFISQNDSLIGGFDLSMIFGIVYVVIWIIQALDANRLAKKYNKYLMANSKPLWY